jgi:branched-chain amino acid aminotransferase
MGGMNLYFVYGSEGSARLVTPELTGALLPGVTRDSILQVASDLGIDAETERVSVEDWRQGNADGSITEVFACGTAAVITPVGQVKWREGGWSVGSGEPGALTMKLRERLLDIQHGRRDDTHGWMHPLVVA